MRYLRRNTSVSLYVGHFIDWADGKTLLADNETFDPDKISCDLVKDSVGVISTGQYLTRGIRIGAMGRMFGNFGRVAVELNPISLSKTGGSNNINLIGNGLATLDLAATDVDVAGQLRISFTNAVIDGYPSELILPFTEDFVVLHEDAYDALFIGDLNEPIGLASSLWQKINQIWRRFFKQSTCNDLELKTYRNDGTVNTTQSVSDNGAFEMVGDAQ